MSDLVKRLRNYMPDGQDDSIHSEAADRIAELERRLEAVREIAIEGIRAWEYDSQDISMKLCEALGESLVTGCDPLHFGAIGGGDE